MFSYEDRLRAIELLLQYDMSYSTVRRELGYPSKEYIENMFNNLYFKLTKNSGKVSLIYFQSVQFMLK